MKDQKNLKWFVEQIQMLPTLPVVAMKLEEEITNPRSSAAEVSDVIKQDPSLTARILKIANSAYYGFPQTIGTVNLAVVVIGFDALISLCRVITVSNHINRWSSFSEERIQNFWRHSMVCAELARLIARQINVRASGELYTAGILHDIGVLIFSNLKKEEYTRIDNQVMKDHSSRTEMEEMAFGVGHAELGALLLRHWKLPERISLAIEGHHAPVDADISEDAQILRLSNRLAHIITKAEKEVDRTLIEYYQKLFLRKMTEEQVREKVEQLFIRIRPALEHAEDVISVLNEG